MTPRLPPGRDVVVLIVAVLLAGGACGRKGPEPEPPALARSAAAPIAPPPPAPPPPAAKPPERTELDRTPGFAAQEEDRPRREGNAYVAACPITGQESASVRIGKDRRLALVNGARTLAVVKLDDDFFTPDVQVSCAKSFVTLHREQGDRYRDATLTWTGHRLVKSGRSDGPIPPMRGP